jgi:hypothetical protein
MADEPKKTGVYNAPGSTSTTSSKVDSTLKSTSGSTSNIHGSTSAKSSAGMFAAVPTWAWIVAVVVVLAILAMMLF